MTDPGSTGARDRDADDEPRRSLDRGRPGGPPLDDDELVTAYGLLSESAVKVTQRLSEGLGVVGHLTLAEFDVLIRLRREPIHKLPMSRIASELGVTPGGFTKLVDRMERDDLVVRERSTEDRRVIYAVLTGHGEELIDVALIHHVQDLRKHLLEPLGDDRLRLLASLTRILRDHPG